MKSLFEWRRQYDLDADEAERHLTDIACEDESLTVQDAPDADINVLIKRFGIHDGSILPGLDYNNVDPRLYGDFTDVPDLKTALDRTRAATSTFEQLPAELRARFHNNPWELYDFVNNPKNDEEAIELGLLAKKASEPILKPTEGTPASAEPPKTPS